MKSIRQNLQITDYPKKFRTRRPSKELSRRQNNYSSIVKFKKLHLKIKDHGTS